MCFLIHSISLLLKWISLANIIRSALSKDIVVLLPNYKHKSLNFYVLKIDKGGVENKNLVY